MKFQFKKFALLSCWRTNSNNGGAKIILFFILMWCGVQLKSNAQSTQQVFGKNRVQYKPLVWSYYESANFTTYFSTGGQPLAKFVVQAAEKNLDDIKQTLEYPYSGKIEILVFGDISDFNQSNVGYEPGEESYNIGGVTKILGNKIFVYFDGDHKHLNIQIRQGIAKVLMDNILFGSSVQEVVQNAVLLNLPDWYVDGLVAYIAEPWSTSKDNRLRDYFNRETISSFPQLVAMDGTYAGQSFWNFVNEKFDNGTIGNLLYITRINRSMEAGFLFVLGKGVSESYDEWFNFYKERYAAELKNRKKPNSKYFLETPRRKRVEISAAKISADGNYIAYISNDLGRYKLMIKPETGKAKAILKNGLRNTLLPVDAQNPVFTWDCTGKTLFAFFMKHKILYYMEYDLATRKRTISQIDGFNKIIEATWGADKNTLLLTAVKGSSSDIYIYNHAAGRNIPITDDFWDDKNPHYVNLNGKKGIVFASNRQSDTLKRQLQDTSLQIKPYDVFFYNLQKKTLTRISKTPLFDEGNPMQYNKQTICYLSDQNGIYNRFMAVPDSAFVRTDSVVYFKDSTVTNPRFTAKDSLLHFPNSLIDSIRFVKIYRDTFSCFAASNYAYNIMQQEIPSKSKFVLESFLEDGRMQFYKIPIKDSLLAKDKLTNTNSIYRTHTLTPDAPKAKLDEITSDAKDNTVAPLPKDSTLNNHTFASVFQSEFVMPWDTSAFYLKDTATQFIKEPLFKLNRIIPYRAKMYTSNFETKLDKGTMFTHVYQPFTGSPNYVVPAVAMWNSITVKDIMEDHQLAAGFSIPSNFGSLAFYLRYSNLKKRLDKQYTYYRLTESNQNVFAAFLFQNNGELKYRYKVHYMEGKFTYPIDEFRHFALYTAARVDIYHVLSTDTGSLHTPKYQEDWAIGRLEYVHDNTHSGGINILYGLRYKVFVEFNQLANIKNHNFGYVGIDFRYYQKVFRTMIWANRVAGSSSFGKDKMLYYVGGVDGWLWGGGNKNTVNPVNNTENYAYQTLATNLRGFRYNARNGSNFFVWNSELRIPLYTMLSKKPSRTEFIKNFQVINFFDVGSGWVGPSPLSDQAKISFTDKIVKGPLTIETNYFRNPILFGYGFGFRTTFFGYFVRLDYAWGIDNGKVMDKVTYISVSTDF